ncbi:MAG TPA: helix-turn-helix transcriptional regulator [Acidimicrobiales bacterium]|nr:helix-turn-helix transcriptional regulator [Acidimicrobiales bacterium]
MAGLSRMEVAADLQLSLHTVNAHVMAIFDKADVPTAG